ncbi:biotin carboxylase N-terminal domain-containing protein, partial [Aeromonas sp. R9-1]
MSPIRRLLIANRGEIACRIIRTARTLGIHTIAVYSEADEGALHTTLADEAWPIGPAAARESYLDGEKILAVARAARADAVHPGYGFLSENDRFAERLEQEGLIFVGPPASAIRAMGDKAGAKALMAAAGLPLMPGYHGEDQSEATLLAEARHIPLPLLIKAAAGGGGKGMRRVDRLEDLCEALASVRREAASAFGDERVLLERYLERARHVEVQIFADRHGHAIYLGDRDCSLQRRHQKVIEEAPAPSLPDSLRQAMGEASVAAALAIGYVGAGTMEFLVSGDDFYFMEMNT